MKMLTRIYKEDKDALKEYLMSRTQDLSTDVLVTVSNIIQDVKENKDEACLKYTQQFDKVSLDTMEVSQEEWDAQILKCDDSFVEAMKLAKENIEDFHKLQKQNGYLLQKEKGIYLGQSSNSLSSTNLIDFIYTGKFSRIRNIRVNRSIFIRWSYHNNIFNTGNFCG